jgi:GNAT superfamily N-acetyltransferase
MSSYRLRHPRPDEAGAAARVYIDHEVGLYGATTYTPADMEVEWKDYDLDRDVWIAEDDTGVIGYATLHERGELYRGDAYAVTKAVRVGIVELLERTAAERGARRFQIGMLERDEPGRRLLEKRGYRPVRIFREMRIELDAAPAPAELPEGLRFDEFDPGDARALHAAQQEAFSDHWEFHPRPFDEWRKYNIENEHFDATLWNVVRDGDEIAAGTINVAPFAGGGWVQTLFTRRPWRGRGIAGALLQDSFRRFWEHGYRTVGLGVDSESDTGAFRVYERAGMRVALGWEMYERELDRAP